MKDRGNEKKMGKKELLEMAVKTIVLAYIVGVVGIVIWTVIIIVTGIATGIWLGGCKEV